MKKSASCSSSGPENAKFVPCRCPGNPKFARRSERPPLISIQGEAVTKACLSLDYQQKGIRNESTKLLKDCNSLKDSKAPATAYLERPTRSRSRSISPIPSSSKSYESGKIGNSHGHKDLLPKAFEPHTSSSSKFLYYKPTERTQTQRIQNPCAESTRITQTVHHSSAHTHAKQKAASSGRQSLLLVRKSQFPYKDARDPSQTTASEDVKVHLCQERIKERSNSILADVKLPIARSVCESRASLNQRNIPKVVVSKRSTLMKPHEAKEQQISSSNSPSIITTTTRASTSRSSSGYSSLNLTESDIISKSARRYSELVDLPSQKFTTLTQETMSLAWPSYSSSTTKAGKPPLASLTVSEWRSSISPTGEAIYLAAQMGKVRLTRDTSIICESEIPFVPMDQFFHDLGNGGVPKVETIPVSPCYLNEPPPARLTIFNKPSTYLDENIRKPAVKTTLMRNSQPRKPSLMYSPDYDEDIISYSFQLRTRFLVSKVLFNTYMNNRSRTSHIEWILKISNYVIPQIDSVFYMSVRLFDYTIITLKLKSPQYQLAAVVAIWISGKHLESINLQVPKIYSLCGGKYSKNEILSMEKRMLKSMNFCLSTADPLDFLNNYLKSSNLDADKLLRYGANFVLECSTMFDIFASTEAPFLSAASLYLAYQVLKRSTEVYINFVWYRKNTVELFVDSVLKKQVFYAIKHKLEPAQKYSTAENLYVARHFFK